MEERELTCIGCPMGCSLKVEIAHGEILAVRGNTCKKGEDYARKEVTNPTRIVTTTVPVRGGKLPQVSVKTQTDIPRDKVMMCMEALKNTVVSAPVKIGDGIKENVAGTGVWVIATKNVDCS